MPKRATYPTLYDESIVIEMANLKDNRYFEADTIKSRIMTWRNKFGERTAYITINTFIIGANPYIELDYNYKENPVKYKVALIQKQSNLNKGTYFYFECPVTKKLCRKLYLINGVFLHREAFTGCLYQCQKWSKKVRPMITFFKIALEADIETKRYFKKSYNNKPTKRYLDKQEKDSAFLEKYEHLRFDNEASKKMFGF
jgi:hypothetical protein